MKNIFLLIMISLIAIAISTPGDTMKEFSKGLVLGYTGESIIINENCFGTDFDKDYSLLLEAMTKENYAYLTLKLQKIGFELYSKCNAEIINIFKNFTSLPSILDLLNRLNQLMPPLIEIYVSETKTYIEYGVATGKILAVLFSKKSL